MELTRKESKVVEHLRHTGIATISALRKAVDVSHMTVVRAPNKNGYQRSVLITMLPIQEFDRLRTALGLASVGDNPMHHGYELDAQHGKQVQEAFDSLPVRILRQADFVERVLGIYEDQCCEMSKTR